MNTEHLLTHFARLTDAPDAIPRLRRFILDLAVRGKLVEQDPEDEPANISFTDGKRRNLDQYVSATLPAGWLVAPVGSLLNFQYGKGMKASERLVEGPVPVFGSNGIVGYCETPLTEKPSIIVGRKGSAGALNLCYGPSWTTDVAYFVEAPAFFDLRYLLIGLQTLNLEALGKGVKPGLSRSDAYELLLRVPPLAEQHRIVAKVDKLMTVCDRLETARKEQQATRNRLTAASLARLNAPAPDPAVFQNHTAFALNNLTPLTARPDQIKALRQTLLNLAVRGKLVEQDQGDEPVSKQHSGKSECEGLPVNWRRLRLEEFLTENTRNGYSQKPDDAPDGIPILRISAGTTRVDGLVAEEEHKLISGIGPDIREKYCLMDGDLLACRFNGNKEFVGKMKLFRDYLQIQPIYPDKLIRVRVDPFKALPEFVRIAGESDIVRQQVEAFCATTVGNWGISASKLKKVVFPLPPLAEQHRIVAKVDELMAVCDRLEESLIEGEEARGRLVEVLLSETLDQGSISV